MLPHPIIKPLYADAPAYCHYFFDLVTDNDLIEVLQSTKASTLALIEKIPAAKWQYAYAENKWTTIEVLRHIIDCERVYAYRALRFSRMDATELAGFDENQFIAASNPINSSMTDIAEEFDIVRQSTIKLFAPLTDAMLDFKAKANRVDFTARGLGYMAAGHNIHHCNVIINNYL